MTPLLHIPNHDITLKDSDLRVLFKKKSAVACVTPNWCVWIKEHPWVMTVDTTPCVIPIHDMTYAPKLIRSMMSHAPSFSSHSKLTISGLFQIKIQVSQSAGFWGTQYPSDTASETLTLKVEGGWRYICKGLRKETQVKKHLCESCLKFWS